MYIVKHTNDIKYFANGKFVKKEDAQVFSWEDAEELQKKLKRMCINVVIESK